MKILQNFRFSIFNILFQCCDSLFNSKITRIYRKSTGIFLHNFEMMKSVIEYYVYPLNGQSKGTEISDYKIFFLNSEVHILFKSNFLRKLPTK